MMDKEVLMMNSRQRRYFRNKRLYELRSKMSYYKKAYFKARKEVLEYQKSQVIIQELKDMGMYAVK